MTSVLSFRPWPSRKKRSGSSWTASDTVHHSEPHHNKSQQHTIFHDSRYMAGVTELRLSCHLVLLSIDSKTREQDGLSSVTSPIYTSCCRIPRVYVFFSTAYPKQVLSYLWLKWSHQQKGTTMINLGAFFLIFGYEYMYVQGTMIEIRTTGNKWPRKDLQMS